MGAKKEEKELKSRFTRFESPSLRRTALLLSESQPNWLRRLRTSSSKLRAQSACQPKLFELQLEILLVVKVQRLGIATKCESTSELLTCSHQRRPFVKLLNCPLIPASMSKSLSAIKFFKPTVIHTL